MITFNGFIISRLRKSKKRIAPISRRNQMQIILKQAQASSNVERRDSKFVRATVTMDFLFLAFFTPVGVVLTIESVDLLNKAISSVPTSSVLLDLFGHVAQLIAILYHAMGVFIFWTFNQHFRDEVIYIIFVKKSIWKKTNYTNNSTKLQKTNERL